MKTGCSRSLKWSRLLEARSEKRRTSFGWRESSSLMLESSSPFTILTENFLSRRWKVLIRIAALVIPSVSWWDMILMGLFSVACKNSLVKVSISFNMGVKIQVCLKIFVCPRVRIVRTISSFCHAKRFRNIS